MKYDAELRARAVAMYEAGATAAAVAKALNITSPDSVVKWVRAAGLSRSRGVQAVERDPEVPLPTRVRPSRARDPSAPRPPRQPREPSELRSTRAPRPLSESHTRCSFSGVQTAAWEEFDDFLRGGCD